MNFLKLSITTSLILALFSCSYSGQQIKPSVTGKAGEVIVVISKANWESEPGTAIRSILAVDYPQLPQKEPLFTLFDIPENKFSKIFKSHRNIIIVNTLETLDTIRFAYQKNVWADPQTVITISAPNKKEVTKLINENGPRLKSILEQAERDRIIRNTKKYEEPVLRGVVTNNIGGSPFFPNGYNLKKQTEDFIWISYETTYTNQGILIYSYPYEPGTPLNLNSIIEKRNKFLAENIPGMFDNSYMITSMEPVSPELKWIEYNNRDFAETRGLWEMENDFMGGPFISHSFYDKEGKNIIVLEGFVYAPKYDKRNYLRQIESILYSFEWKAPNK